MQRWWAHWPRDSFCNKQIYKLDYIITCWLASVKNIQDTYVLYFFLFFRNANWHILRVNRHIHFLMKLRAACTSDILYYLTLPLSQMDCHLTTSEWLTGFFQLCRILTSSEDFVSPCCLSISLLIPMAITQHQWPWPIYHVLWSRPRPSIPSGTAPLWVSWAG